MEDKEEETPIHTTKPFLPLSLLKPKVGWNLDLDTDISILMVDRNSLQEYEFIQQLYTHKHMTMYVHGHK